MEFALKPCGLCSTIGISWTVCENVHKRRRLDNELDEQSPWAYLPDPVLADIFTLSTVEDRSSMLQVCRWWSEQHEVESIRRTISINIPQSTQHRFNDYPEVKYAEKYGGFLKHVDINFKKDLSMLTENELNQLQLIMGNLGRHAQLNSVGFHESGTCSYFDDGHRAIFNSCFNHVTGYRAIQSFLLTQHKLTSVKFWKCYFRKHEIRDILRAIFKNNRETLVNLDLRGFFRNSCPEYTSLFYRGVFSLRTLAIDYCDTFECMITDYVECLKRKINKDRPERNVLLQRIKLSCTANRERSLNGIPSEIWSLVKEACPNLSVDISYSPGINGVGGVRTYLRRHIPLRSLEIIPEIKGVSCQLESVGFFGHLTACEFHDTLEELSVVWTQGDVNFVEVFTEFTMICTRLKRVIITVQDNDPNLCNLFHNWAENKPRALEFAHISIVSILTREEIKHFNDLSDHYVSTLKHLGLRLVLITNTLT